MKKENLNVPNGCEVGKRRKSGMLDFLFCMLGTMSMTFFDVLIVAIFYMPTDEVLYTLVTILYFVNIFAHAIMWGFILDEGSIGKKKCKMKVVDIKTGKKPNCFKLLLVNLSSFGARDDLRFNSRLDRRTLFERLLKCSIVDLDEMWELTDDGRWIKKAPFVEQNKYGEDI